MHQHALLNGFLFVFPQSIPANKCEDPSSADVTGLFFIYRFGERPNWWILWCLLFLMDIIICMYMHIYAVFRNESIQKRHQSVIISILNTVLLFLWMDAIQTWLFGDVWHQSRHPRNDTQKYHVDPHHLYRGARFLPQCLGSNQRGRWMLSCNLNENQRDEPKMNRLEELEFSSLHFVTGLIWIHFGRVPHLKVQLYLMSFHFATLQL